VNAGPGTTLLIADDQALVRVGLRKILENEPRTTVVGEAGNGQDAVAAVRRLRPDVVLMDIRMPVLDGIEATRQIVRAQPSTRVLILTTFGLDDYVYDALRAGASGFMLKDAPPEEIAVAKTHVAKILQKLGVRDRLQAVIYAYETGLISPSPLSGQVTAGVGETPGREWGIAAFHLPARDPYRLRRG